MARYLGLGKEASFGSAAALSKYIAIVSEDIQLQKERIIQEDVSSRQRSKWRPGTERVGGGWRWNIHYENIGEILLGLLGQVATSQPDSVNAPNTYQHIFSPSDSIPTWTVEVGLDEVTAKQAVGVAIEGVSLRLSPNELFQGEVDIIGKTLSLKALSTPSFPTLDPIAFYDVSSIQVGGVAANLIEAEINIANNIVDDAFVLGSRQLDRIELGYIEVAGSFSLAFDSTSEMDKFLSDTESSLQILMQGAVIEATYNYKLQIDIPRIVYSEAQASIDRRERIIQNINFVALKPTADDIIKFTLVNTESGY